MRPTLKQYAHSHLLKWQTVLSIFCYIGDRKYFIKFIFDPLFPRLNWQMKSNMLFNILEVKDNSSRNLAEIGQSVQSKASNHFWKSVYLLEYLFSAILYCNIYSVIIVSFSFISQGFLAIGWNDIILFTKFKVHVPASFVNVTLSI